MALPTELERYDALIDVLVDALVREFETEGSDQTQESRGSDGDA